jgi:diguanylate cyclase (GGDEF)-like protein
MAIPNMSDDEMRAAARELEQALYNHEQWAETIYSTLICRLAPDQRDIGEDAHRLCRFGQWLYKSGIDGLERHPGFAEIGLEHERMHQGAARLLRTTMDGAPITINEYERFVTAMKRMRLELATLRHELEDALYNLDPLTGTPSRIGMLTKLREQHALVARRMQACTIAMMDLDKFKAINDKFGHLVGDRVLIAIARYVMAHLRPYDKVFRYGGEEFLVFLPDADLQTGRDIIERLRTELASLPHETKDKEPFHVTVSFGLTLLDPDIPVEQSIDRADKALYVAKTTGRNHTVAWDASMKISENESEKAA